MKALSNKPVSEKDIVEWANREAIPVLKELRKAHFLAANVADAALEAAEDAQESADDAATSAETALAAADDAQDAADLAIDAAADAQDAADAAQAAADVKSMFVSTTVTTISVAVNVNIKPWDVQAGSAANTNNWQWLVTRPGVAKIHAKIIAIGTHTTATTRFFVVVNGVEPGTSSTTIAIPHTDGSYHIAVDEASFVAGDVIGFRMEYIVGGGAGSVAIGAWLTMQIDFEP